MKWNMTCLCVREVSFNEISLEVIVSPIIGFKSICQKTSKQVLLWTIICGGVEPFLLFIWHKTSQSWKTNLAMALEHCIFVKLPQHPIIISWFSLFRKLTLLQKPKAVWLPASHVKVPYKLVLLFKNQSDSVLWLHSDFYEQSNFSLGILSRHLKHLSGLF